MFPGATDKEFERTGGKRDRELLCGFLVAWILTKGWSSHLILKKSNAEIETQTAYCWFSPQMFQSNKTVVVFFKCFAI